MWRTNPRNGFQLLCYNFTHFGVAKRTGGPKPILTLALFALARWNVREHIRGMAHIDRLVDHVQVLLGESWQIINDYGRLRKSIELLVEVDQG